jgi:hypothetical protein
MQPPYLRRAMVEAARREQATKRPQYVFQGRSGWDVSHLPPKDERGFQLIDKGVWHIRTHPKPEEKPSAFIQGLKQVSDNVAAGRPWWQGAPELLAEVKALAQPPREQWEIDRDVRAQRAIECAEHEAKYEPGHGY